jgi:hypothetical protein
MGESRDKRYKIVKRLEELREEEKLKIKKVVHYAEEDKEFISDYYSIELFINGERIKKYGDWYHDKGDEKCDAFIEGIMYMYGGGIDYKLEEVADGLV